MAATLSLTAKFTPSFAMTDAEIQSFHAAVANIRAGGYDQQINYAVLTELVDRIETKTTRWVTETRIHRPNMDWVNLVSTLTGALNYELMRHFSRDSATEVLGSPARLEAFVENHYQTLLNLSATRHNNPTAPQRAIPCACQLPSEPRSLGVIELGCSRGDIGLVLTNLDEVSRDADELFMPGWNADVKLRTAARRGADQYLGIDPCVPDDDDWLMALWGLHDERRLSLQRFYSQYRSEDDDGVDLFEADAIEYEAYRHKVASFAANSDYVVVLTSFMLYQLQQNRRWDLARVIHRIHQDVCGYGEPFENCVWYNQGLPVRPWFSGELAFDDLEFTRITFENEHVIAKPIYSLRDDLCSDWSLSNRQSVVVGLL